MRRFALLFLPVAAMAAQFPGSDPVPTAVRKGFESIRETDARQTLGFLTGAECAGRGSGTPGYQKAADYVAERFRLDGLKPGGEQGYFQYGTLYRSKVESGSLRIGRETVRLGTDLNLGETNANLAVSAPVVLVRVRDKRSDLPEGVDLHGKVVLLVGPGVDFSIRVDVREQKPAAILNAKASAPRTVWNVRGRKPETTRTIGTISEAAVRRLAKEAGFAGDPLSAEGMSNAVEVSELTGAGRLEAKVQAGEVKVPNVVAVLPGTDPLLKQEVVGVGAHLDHLGDNGEQVWPGADDDGSGVAAVLEVAQAFAQNPIKPKRTIVFMTFYGEEMGLLGSRLYSSKPTFPLDRWVAELQMDMVGRDTYGPQNGDSKRIDVVEQTRDTMRLVDSKRISTGLHQAVLDANRYVGLRFLYDGEDVYERSDHYSFASKGVPVAFLFDGFTPDYHQPTDTVDKIDWTKLTNAARLVYLTAWDLGNRAQRLVNDVTAGG